MQHHSPHHQPQPEGSADVEIAPLDWDPIPLAELLKDAAIVKAASPDEDRPKSPDAIDTRSGFFAAIDAAIQLAIDNKVNELWLCDVDFSAWPLGQRSTIERLDAWVAAHRKLHVLACDFHWLTVECPRWVAWRRRWAHVVECQQVGEEDATHMRSLMLVPSHQAIALLDAQRGRGRILRDAADLASLGELFEDLTHRAVAAMPPTTLGL